MALTAGWRTYAVTNAQTKGERMCGARSSNTRPSATLAQRRMALARGTSRISIAHWLTRVPAAGSWGVQPVHTGPGAPRIAHAGSPGTGTFLTEGGNGGLDKGLPLRH